MYLDKWILFWYIDNVIPKLFRDIIGQIEMNEKEMIERGFTSENGKILDDFGNEYRNEEGQIELLEEGLKEFVKHVDEWDNKGINWGLSDLREIAKKYSVDEPDTIG